MSQCFGQPQLLTLPTEIRLHIYNYLLSGPDITVRSLFIRAGFRNVFMSQQPKSLCCDLLQVCKQISHEALPILYGSPAFECACRIEQLSAQVGLSNFSHIKKMCVDADDLPEIVTALGYDGNETGIKFQSLECLQTEGYRAAALMPNGSKADRLDALALCKTAQGILALHPILKVLYQAGEVGSGGADGVDDAYCRVKWRFVKDARMKSPVERVVDLTLVTAAIQALEKSKLEDSALPRTLLRTQNQHPYFT